MLMLKLFVYLQTVVSAVLTDDDRRDQHGQATAEYALVLLGVAAVALLVGVWAAKTNLIGKLFDLVFRKIFDKA
jgi:Flp pilus assembly pilin Flp